MYVFSSPHGDEEIEAGRINDSAKVTQMASDCTRQDSNQVFLTSCSLPWCFLPLFLWVGTQVSHQTKMSITLFLVFHVTLLQNYSQSCAGACTEIENWTSSLFSWFEMPLPFLKQVEKHVALSRWPDDQLLTEWTLHRIIPWYSHLTLLSRQNSAWLIIEMQLVMSLLTMVAAAPISSQKSNP
jgi:hypothetical protein